MTYGPVGLTAGAPRLLAIATTFPGLGVLAATMAATGAGVVVLAVVGAVIWWERRCDKI